VDNALELSHFLTVIKVVREVAFFEAVAATKHCFKVVRTRAQHCRVYPNFFVRVEHKDDIVEEVEVSALDHVADDSVIETAELVLRRLNALAGVIQLFKIEVPLTFQLFQTELN